jgi:predicted  nucleic acid-binding Zn-ribbon protein
MEDVIAQLIRLQELDRIRDKLQRRLDQVPVRLKSHTDAIRALEEALSAQEQLHRAAKAESDRAELEVKSKEEEREKIKRQMNAPKLSNREYEMLQEAMAGVLADINSHTDQAVKAMQRAEEAETQVAELKGQLDKAQSEFREAKEKLESGLGDVTGDLAKRDEERKEKIKGVGADALRTYERVRRKHKDALALVEGTIDRAAGRIGNDLHCSACYMTITANDAVKVLGRKELITCKSCVRILYVP